MTSYIEKIKAQALASAMAHHLSEMPPVGQVEAALEAMSNNNASACRALGIEIWEPFVHESLSEIANRIANAAETEEAELLKAVELYKESVVSESVAGTIKKLADGVVADIYFDAKSYGDEVAAGRIEDTQNAMRTACDQLYAMSVLLQKDVPVRPWDASEYGDACGNSHAPTHIMSVDDQRLSNGQLYVDIKDPVTGFGVMSVTHEIDTEGRPTAHLHFDDSQVAASFRKTADREIVFTMETNIRLDYVSAGVYKFSGNKDE